MNVTIYGSDGCGFCEKAVDLAEELCLDYTYIDANTAMIEFSRLFPGAKTVPQILVNGSGSEDIATLKKSWSIFDESSHRKRILQTVQLPLGI